MGFEPCVGTQNKGGVAATVDDGVGRARADHRRVVNGEEGLRSQEGRGRDFVDLVPSKNSKPSSEKA